MKLKIAMLTIIMIVSSLTTPVGAFADTTKESFICRKPLDLGAVVNARVKGDEEALNLLFSTMRCMSLPDGLPVTVIRTEVEGIRCKVRLGREAQPEGYMFCFHINRGSDD